MTVLKYEKEIVALLVVDPYNDFISEEGKVASLLAKRLSVFKYHKKR